MRQIKTSGVKVSIASSSKPCFYRNRRPRGWTFYLAVTENERRRIDAFEVLKPSVFSYVPGRDIGAFFELFRSPYAAVREAMKSAKDALEPTTWFILSLHFRDNAVAQLFMNTEEPCLKHGPQGKGFRVYGTLDISKLDKAWDQMKKDALGIDAWKENAIEKCLSYSAGQCAECKVEDEEVFKSKKPCEEWYCALCWHKYILNSFKALEQDVEYEELYIVS